MGTGEYLFSKYFANVVNQFGIAASFTINIMHSNNLHCHIFKDLKNDKTENILSDYYDTGTVNCTTSRS